LERRLPGLLAHVPHYEWQYISGQYKMKMPWEKITAEAWRRVFQELAMRKNWIQMKQFVVDESSCGHMSVCGKDVQISSLIEYCHGRDGKDQSRYWGQTLAIALMERGSSFPKTCSVALMKKALDFGIDTGRISSLPLNK
jgi:hypothetical protein